MARFNGGLRQQIQHTLNLFNPLTLSEAHQQALTVETQNRSSSSSWSAPRQRQPTTTTTPTTNTNTTTPADTAIIPAEQTRPACTGTIRCFSCGELGQRVSACPSRNRRGLLLDTTGRDVELILPEDDLPPTYDESPEELEADSGISLMLRRRVSHHTHQHSIPNAMLCSKLAARWQEKFAR